MWKKLGLTVVACGVMLGVAGFADAGTVAVKNTNRATVQRTTVKPHKRSVRTHKTIMHRHTGTINKTSFQSNVARRGFRGGFRHHNSRMMFRHV
ncbi:MAG: hypothetical protein JWN70_3350 [Planctomycetaceae bacterium]|nr:hypothetical protein [Planctomycetaceae bacterium]